MKILYRVVDKETKLFLYDGFTFNPETEIGLDTKPAEGLLKPLWNGEGWEEGATAEEIAAFQAVIAEREANQPATTEEMLNALYGVE